MMQLDDIMQRFEFSDAFEQFVKDSEQFDTYNAIADDTIYIEIEQQNVVSTNSFICDSHP